MIIDNSPIFILLGDLNNVNLRFQIHYFFYQTLKGKVYINRSKYTQVKPGWLYYTYIAEPEIRLFKTHISIQDYTIVQHKIDLLYYLV